MTGPLRWTKKQARSWELVCWLVGAVRFQDANARHGNRLLGRAPEVRLSTLGGGALRPRTADLRSMARARLLCSLTQEPAGQGNFVWGVVSQRALENVRTR